MSALRSKLIRLAHERPEIRADLLPLLKQSAGNVPTDPEVAKQALEALNALFAHVKAPVKWTNITENAKDVPIPKGFASMWKSLAIEVRWQRAGGRLPFYANVDWRYSHPSGGSNGVTIGYVMLDPDEGKWGWRDEQGHYGMVD